MHVITNITDMKNLIQDWRQAGHSIGFVPTMGYLHDGHASLIQRAHAENDKVVVSIFVNPTQFGVNEDLDAYPRDLEKDKIVVEENGGNVIFHPTNEEMYPEHFYTHVSVSHLTNTLCGQSRPTHFDGVTLVVTKLFNIVSPHKAYFGEKDAQQLAVIRKMTRDLNMNVKIIACPIIRESDGLAMSSRNSYLSQAERQDALVLSKAIAIAKNLFDSGITNSSEIKKEMEKIILSVSTSKIDYIEIVDSSHLSPVSKIEKSVLIAIAVFIGKTRLIDNITLNGRDLS